MPCCCVKTLNLCNTPVCGSILFDLDAELGTEGGIIYKLVLDYLGNQITIYEEQTEGDNIHFDVSGLNEGFEYTGQVYDANGDLISFLSGSETFDCIKFKTIVSIEIDNTGGIFSEVFS